MSQLLGIFAARGVDPDRVKARFEALAAEYEARGETVSVVLAEPNVIVAVTGAVDAYAVEESPRRVIAIAGEVGCGKTKGAASLTGIGEHPGFDALSDVQGSFVAVSYDRRSKTGWLACDRHGFVQQYYRLDRGVLEFAGNAVRLARSSGDARLDPASVVSMLAFGQVFGAASMYEGVRLLGPAEVLKAGPEGIERLPKRTYTYASTAKPVTTEELHRALVRSVAALEDIGQEVRRSVVPLSGGLDSRTVLAAACASSATPLLSFTFGSPMSADSVIARATARMLDVPHRQFDLSPDALLETMDDVVEITSGELNVIHSHGFTAYPEVTGPGDVMLSGFAGDLTIGGSFIRPTDEQERVSGLVDRLREGLPPDLLSRILTPDAAELIRQVEWELHEQFHALPEDDLDNKGDHFALLTRARRFTANGLKLVVAFAPCRLPFFERDLFELTLTLPVDQRRDSRLYLDVYRRKMRRLARLPWQATGVPPAGGLWLPWPSRGTYIPRISAPASLRARLRASFVDYNRWFAGPLVMPLRTRLKPMAILETGVLRPDAYLALLEDVGKLPAQSSSILLSLEIAAGALTTTTPWRRSA